MNEVDYDETIGHRMQDNHAVGSARGMKAELIAKLESLEDDGSEGMPWSQEELDMIIQALRAFPQHAEEIIKCCRDIHVHGATNEVVGKIIEAVSVYDNDDNAKPSALDKMSDFWRGYTEGLDAAESRHTDTLCSRCGADINPTEPQPRMI